MKMKLTALLLALTNALAFGHGGVALGPNGGRVLEFSKDHTTAGEVTVKEGKFHISVLNKDLKPVKVGSQSLTAIGGTRAKPVKLEVSKSATGFSLPLVKEGEWLILQFKEDDKAQTVTARLAYDTSICDGCKKAEWLCECKKAEPKKEPKKDAGKKEK